MNSVVMFLEDNIRFIFLYASKISVFGGVQVLGKTKAKKKKKKITNSLEMPARKTSFCVDGSQQISWHQLPTPHPTAIARKPKCQLVLMFGVSWREKKKKKNKQALS